MTMPSKAAVLDEALTRLETEAKAYIERNAKGADAIRKLDARRAHDHVVDDAMVRINALSDLFAGSTVDAGSDGEGNEDARQRGID